MQSDVACWLIVRCHLISSNNQPEFLFNKIIANIKVINNQAKFVKYISNFSQKIHIVDASVGAKMMYGCPSSHECFPLVQAILDYNLKGGCYSCRLHIYREANQGARLSKHGLSIDWQRHAYATFFVTVPDFITLPLLANVHPVRVWIFSSYILICPLL